MDECKYTREAQPLIDEHLQSSWRADMSSDEVRDIVAAACGLTLSGLADIERALTRNDRPALRRAAHKLKGMVGNLGAVRLARRLLAIELAAAADNGPAPSLEGLTELVEQTVAAMHRSIEEAAPR